MSVLSLVGVSFSVPRGRERRVGVLAGVSLEVGAGELVSVLAQRAQGKTTLLRVAAGMERPCEGRVFVAGKDLWGLSDARRVKLLGDEVRFVGRDRPSIELPVLDNIALPLQVSGGYWRVAYARAMEALERVGAAECARQHWKSLADWERALVAIAGGIVCIPKLLLIDDLTVLLGIEETEEVVRLVSTLAKELGFGVLMCVSGAGATGWSGRIATLAGGELLEPNAPRGEHDNVVDFSNGLAGRDPGYGISS
jgi:ABC-type methionine transport system ATPase subunit